MNSAVRETPWIAILALWAGAALIAAPLAYRWRTRSRARSRMMDPATAAAAGSVEDQDRLSRWLLLAGYRSPNRVVVFVLATIACTFAGAGSLLLARSSGLVNGAVHAAEGIPGGAGDLARPVVLAAPWILFAAWVLLPWQVVSARRKRRVREVEEDLSVTLDLLATMSESGLAFDGALARVVDAGRMDRPLFEELEIFRVESMGGVPRSQCFRRLGSRIDVPSVTAFVSALVQADQVGAGFSQVLRLQADDVRDRRREEANLLAQSLSVKLVFPLVLCFLPGIFVATLGPALLQFLELADSLTQGR